MPRLVPVSVVLGVLTEAVDGAPLRDDVPLLWYQEPHLLHCTRRVIVCAEGFSGRGRNRGVSLSPASDAVDDGRFGKATLGEGLLDVTHVGALKHHLLGEGYRGRRLEVHLPVAAVRCLVALLAEVLLVEWVRLRHVYVEFYSKAIVPARSEGKVPWVLQGGESWTLGDWWADRVSRAFRALGCWDNLLGYWLLCAHLIYIRTVR